MFRQPGIIQRHQQIDVPGRQVDAREPLPFGDIGPSQRIRAEAVAGTAPAEMQEIQPEMFDFTRAVRPVQFFGAFPGRLLDLFQRIAAGDPVAIAGIQPELVFSERNQAVAEICKKLARSLMKRSA